MRKIKHQGYIVQFEGNSYDNAMNLYERVTFFRYDEKGNFITKRDLNFRVGEGFVVPEFESVDEVKRFWSYPNHALLEVKVKTIYDVVER